jgi:hypothetical protein
VGRRSPESADTDLQSGAEPLCYRESCSASAGLLGEQVKSLNVKNQAWISGGNRGGEERSAKQKWKKETASRFDHKH